MNVAVRVVLASDDDQRPAPGTPVRVELRDTTLADAPSTLVAATDGVLERDGDELVADTVIDVDDDAFTPQTALTLWARSGDTARRGVARGDWVTMQSHPVRRADVYGEGPIEITLRPVR